MREVPALAFLPAMGGSPASCWPACAASTGVRRSPAPSTSARPGRRPRRRRCASRRTPARLSNGSGSSTPTPASPADGVGRVRAVLRCGVTPTPAAARARSGALGPPAPRRGSGTAGAAMHVIADPGRRRPRRHRDEPERGVRRPRTAAAQLGAARPRRRGRLLPTRSPRTGSACTRWPRTRPVPDRCTRGTTVASPAPSTPGADGRRSRPGCRRTSASRARQARAGRVAWVLPLVSERTGCRRTAAPPYRTGTPATSWRRPATACRTGPGTWCLHDAGLRAGRPGGTGRPGDARLRQPRQQRLRHSDYGDSSPRSRRTCRTCCAPGHHAAVTLVVVRAARHAARARGRPAGGGRGGGADRPGTVGGVLDALTGPRPRAA